MFGLWDVWDVGCWRCQCSGCEVLGMWDVDIQNSLILIVFCAKLKPKMFMKILKRIKKHLILVIIQKYFDESNKVIAGKMKDETGGVPIDELVGVNPKMYSF